MSNYKQEIKIEGKCLEDIMRLPCVSGCKKGRLAGYYDFTLYQGDMAHPSPFLSASTGDTIAQDFDNKWHVIRNGKELGL